MDNDIEVYAAAEFETWSRLKYVDHRGHSDTWLKLGITYRINQSELINHTLSCRWNTKDQLTRVSIQTA